MARAGHQHHAIAVSWFSKAAAGGWATCTVTELGVIRVCAQLPGTRWAPEATADRLLMMIVTNREYVWWPSAVSPAVLPEVRSAETGKQVTDRYLLATVRRNRGQLVTFDRALTVAGGDSAVCLLPDAE
ncbi:MAG TPA: PIN domain-containing protein [Thermoanaerobaculia bacterium]|nr:PIN domain-containing protein [Thermoanaerobaculia bacterium]